jgi:hypothetical protein
MSESLSHRLILPSARFIGRALDLLAPFDFDGRRGIMVQMKIVDQGKERKSHNHIRTCLATAGKINNRIRTYPRRMRNLPRESALIPHVYSTYEYVPYLPSSGFQSNSKALEQA